MKTKQINPTQPDAMDALVLAVARAADLCVPDLRHTLLEACDAVEAEYDALKAELKALAIKYKEQDWQAIEGVDGLLARVAELEKAEPLTVADQITEWSNANYDKSHAAQTVVEGCWDAGELEAEFETLEAFIEYAGVRDDYREDIISMGGE